MKKYLVLFLLFAGCASMVKPSEEKKMTAPESVSGPERVLDFHAQLTVNDDRSVSVEERILVWCTGVKIRHGIYREIPTNYIDENGYLRYEPLTLRSVTMEGRPSDYHVNAVDNNQRIYIGRENEILPPNRTYLYVIRYDIRDFRGLDKKEPELYWNVVGNRWDFSFDRVSADIRLPAGSQERLLAVQTFLSSRMGTSTNALITKDGDGIHVQCDRKLERREGFTVIARWK